MSRRILAGSALLLGALAMPGCAGQKSAESARAPDVPPGASLEEYEALLADNRAALQRQGLDMDGRDLAAKSEADGGAAAPEAPASPAGGEVSGGDEDMANVADAMVDAEAAPAAPVALEEAASRDMAGPERPTRAERRAAERCDQICDLAASTCEIADRICDLARQHEGESRYQEACTQAESDCAVAQEACLACTR